MGRFWVALVLVSHLLVIAPAVEGDIADTVHNLSATGPGTFKAPEAGEICIFCHTPHNANPARGLWNRALPGVTYKLYTSSTLEATLKQPTGSSRLCLSCHDGTMALGNLRVPPPTGPVALGPLTGRASLGTDLSDDHPISFVYDRALALKQVQLADPATLPKAMRLDATQQLQCTSCHDPHEDRYRKFLRRDDRIAALCTGCHRLKNWSGSAHATSTATWRGTGTNPWPHTPYNTVTENGCGNCHRPHAAPHPPRLLGSSQERGVCLVCHNGGIAAKNLEGEFLKFSFHPIASTDWTHDPREDPNTMPRHVTCADCHNPHQAVSMPGSSPTASGPLAGVRGVNISGGIVAESLYEYEVCLKCHGIKDQITPGITRQDNIRNIRLKINPSNPSYHPIAAVGKNSAIRGLEPAYTASSIISCTDCHNNDEWTATGTRPRGPHGSRHEPILEREFQAGDPVSESFSTYALCYKCHNRSALLSSDGFPHRKHVVEERTSCAVCHDAHGSRQNIRLINFMLRDRTGKTVVGPSRNQGRLEFISLGPGRGQCFLQCHGKNHEPESYP